jgi:multiple sugar transport system substrate-binding protein
MAQRKTLCRLPVVFIFLTLISFTLSCTGRNAQKPPASQKSFVFRGKPESDILFLSTQMNPVEEAGKMRNVILKDFPGKVEFQPNDNNYLFSQIDSILQENRNASILIGALHGDLVKLQEQGKLLPLAGLAAKMAEKGIPRNLQDLSLLDGKNAYYIPWMQASFVMVANKKALAYLPKGANLENLTYDQLARWAEAIYAKTGKKTLGFPAGAKGLMHRFFQGCLYPSFTASTLVKFRSPEAVGMWMYFKNLWRFAHPGSLTYSTMSEPLIAGDVWIAWDHSARLMKIFDEKRDDFIAFPCPIGPKGRGYMAVVSGLAIPKGVVDATSPELLMDYLTSPEIQNRTLKETGFFPVVSPSDTGDIPLKLAGLSSAIDRQANSAESILTLMPIGLGERGGDYNKYFMLTFSEIVLEGKDPKRVLDANAAELQGIVTGEGARCWPPDAAGEGPCKIE